MPNRRRLHPGRWFAALVVVCIVAGGLWWLARPSAELEPTISFKATTATAQSVPLAWPDYGESAIGAVGFGVLDSRGQQTPLPTASLAKVITVLCVLRQHPLRLNEQGPAITITQADVDAYNTYVAEDGSVVRVTVGEQISEYQAIEALLLPSANNMADTLARWAFGSVAAYNTYANAYAKEMGLSSVTVTDPSGFLPTTVASAHDMTVLGQLGMLNPVFAQIVSQPSATIPVQGTINNYNFMLGDNHNIGIKTGNNDQDPGAYLFAYREPVGTTSVTVVGAVMGGPSLGTVLSDGAQLASSAAPYFRQQTVVTTGDTVGSYTVNKKQISAIATQDLSTLTWDGTAYLTSASLKTLTSTTTKAATEVGSVGTVNLTDHTVNSVPVTLRQTAALPGPLQRIRNKL